MSLLKERREPTTGPFLWCHKDAEAQLAMILETAIDSFAVEEQYSMRWGGNCEAHV
jgi:hypothetical protein